jgi:hypothetical protein
MVQYGIVEQSRLEWGMVYYSSSSNSPSTALPCGKRMGSTHWEGEEEKEGGWERELACSSLADYDMQYYTTP